jgi:hypothetical protein
VVVRRSPNKARLCGNDGTNNGVSLVAITASSKLGTLQLYFADATIKSGKPRNLNRTGRCVMWASLDARDLQLVDVWAKEKLDRMDFGSA